jgi:hypothetical protein
MKKPRMSHFVDKERRWPKCQTGHKAGHRARIKEQTLKFKLIAVTTKDYFTKLYWSNFGNVKMEHLQHLIVIPFQLFAIEFTDI